MKSSMEASMVGPRMNGSSLPIFWSFLTFFFFFLNPLLYFHFHFLRFSLATTVEAPKNWGSLWSQSGVNQWI